MNGSRASLLTSVMVWSPAGTPKRLSRRHAEQPAIDVHLDLDGGINHEPANHRVWHGKAARPGRWPLGQRASGVRVEHRHHPARCRRNRRAPGQPLESEAAAPAGGARPLDSAPRQIKATMHTASTAATAANVRFAHQRRRVARVFRRPGSAGGSASCGCRRSGATGAGRARRRSKPAGLRQRRATPGRLPQTPGSNSSRA